MKKNFLKKLAAGLALAMVVTSVAPAATASAATSQISGAPSTVYVTKAYKLKLGKNVKATWRSKDKSVATVGLTGGVLKPVAPGKVQITSKSKVTGKTYKKTFTVKQRATEVDLGDDLQLEVGDTATLEAKLTPETSTDVIRYHSDNKAVATVGMTGGKVTAQGVGEATITVYSKATTASSNKSAYTKTDEIKVTVGDVLLNAVQSASDKVELTFSKDVKDIVKAGNFEIVAKDAVNTAIPVKDLDFSKDGKTVTVNTFVSFKDGTDYTISYTNADKLVQEKTFGATIGTVSSIEVTPTTVPAGKETELNVVLKNAAGVDITNTISTNAYNMSIDVTDGYYDDVNKTLVILEKGKTAKATVTLWATEYDNNGKPLNELKHEQVITAIDPEEVVIGGPGKYTLAAADDTIDWTKATTNRIAIGETKELHIAPVKDSAGNEVDTTALTYSSSNESVLIVNGKTVTPIKKGKAYIIAKDADKKIEWSFLIEVVGERKADSISVDKPTVTLSNTSMVEDTAEVKVTVKDQHGDPMDVTSVIIDKVLSAPKDVDRWTENEDLNATNGAITFSGKGAKEGTYRLLVKATTGNGEKQVPVTVNVLKPNATLTSTYGLKLDKTEVDTTLTDKTAELAKVNAKVVEYKGGVLYDYVKNAELKVYNSANEVVVSGSATTGSFDINAVEKDTDNVLTKLATGTYRVVVKATPEGQTQKTFTQYFKVIDNQTGPTAKVKALTGSTNFSTLEALLAELIEVDGGKKVIKTVTTKPAKNLDSDIKAGEKVFVEKIGVYVESGIGNFVYEISIGKTITNGK